MKDIRISDLSLTLAGTDADSAFTFREKIEVAQLLDRLSVSVIELGSLTDSTADVLLIKAVASSVADSTVSVCPGFDQNVIRNVGEALKEAKHPRLQVCAAVSTARMEYVYHKKSDKMRDAVADTVAFCKTLCDDVEFIAEDATRADFDFLCAVTEAAVQSGASTVTLCDTAGVMLPDEFGDFIRKIIESIPDAENVVWGIRCSDALSVANASAVSAIKNGAEEIKVSAITADMVSLAGLSKLISAKSDALGVKTHLHTTEINHVIKQINALSAKNVSSNSPFEDGVRSYAVSDSFSKDSSAESVLKAVEALGYTLDENDQSRIWKAFCEVAQKKDQVSLGELDAIVASEAMQVPPTYALENFVVTTSNAIDIQAHIKLRMGDEILDGLSLGDGPIDAAFLAIEKITGHHYELDDFQIQAVTEGREAMGQTIVKLRSGGKIYSGKGISTDIIYSGVAAYINALNKIIYEEENA